MHTRDERTMISLIDADLNYLIALLEKQEDRRGKLLTQNLKHRRITREAQVLDRAAVCPSCGEAHQPHCPVRPCAEWEAIQAEERQERETILLREGTRRNRD